MRNTKHLRLCFLFLHVLSAEQNTPFCSLEAEYGFDSTDSSAALGVNISRAASGTPSLVVNGHGGNEHLLPYFAQSQLYKPHDYVVYVQWGHEATKKVGAEKTGPDWHAGESETSNVLLTHPNLVHLDRAGNESGADQKRLKLPENVYTGIWWYARFPNHYSGDGSTATKEQGEADIQSWINAVVRAIKAIKADDESLKLQNEFYEKSAHPLDTAH